MRQGLLSSNAEDESMTFRYPLKIATSLLNVISSLPTTSIEVHGMGIFEKIFEIGNTMLDVMHACGSDDYGGGVEMFVKTLSQTPNSQKQYANLLLQKAAEKPVLERTFAVGFGDVVAPVTRQWRGSIVGEIDDDGVYTDVVEENGGVVEWKEDAVWISDHGNGSETSLDNDAEGEVDMEVDVGVGLDVDWNFAVKIEA